MPHVMIENNRIHYALSRRAPKKGPVAVCVHGSGSDSIVWSYQLSRLSDRFRVIVPDLPGHGRSEGQPLGSAYAYAAWLEKFRSALDLPAFFLLGHSFGGAIVQEYARCHPDKVMGMVLAGTGTRFRMSRTYRDLYERGILPCNDGDAIHEMLPEPLNRGYQMLLKQRGGSLHEDLFASAQFDSSAWVGSLTNPALVIWGDRDEILPRELFEDLAGKLPHSRYEVMNGAGHVVTIDARNEFNRAVADFIEQHSATADI
jgi:pimeloyl-ACP methyl ester carboxylesterase